MSERWRYSRIRQQLSLVVKNLSQRFISCEKSLVPLSSSQIICAIRRLRSVTTRVLPLPQRLVLNIYSLPVFALNDGLLKTWPVGVRAFLLFDSSAQGVVFASALVTDDMWLAHYLTFLFLFVTWCPRSHLNLI